MVQATIFVRPAQLSDVKYVSEATKVINDAYDVSNCWAPGANVITEPRCKDEEILDLIQNSGNPNTLLLAFDESNVVGTVLIKPTDISNSEGELTLFSVCPKYQSRGIGGKLIRQALEEMTRLGFKIVSLMVLDHRVELITWYKKFGFTEFDRYPFVWPTVVKLQNIQALVLKKLLIR